MVILLLLPFLTTQTLFLSNASSLGRLLTHLSDDLPSLICRKICQETKKGSPSKISKRCPKIYPHHPSAWMSYLIRRTIASLIFACWLTHSDASAGELASGIAHSRPKKAAHSDVANRPTRHRISQWVKSVALRIESNNHGENPPFVTGGWKVKTVGFMPRKPIDSGCGV